MSPPRTILFLCTGNSARSLLAEALLNHLAAGRMRAYSAGSFPKGAPHPAALAVLAEQGIATDGLRSKSWDEFAAAGAPEMDLVITVCDNAAGEACPVWPGRPALAHWGIPDPAAVSDPAARPAAFRLALERMRARIAALLALPLAELPAHTLHQRLAEIGRMDGASDGVQGT